MFFKSKSRSIPDPKPLTEDENRSKELAWCYWDCKQYKEKMDKMRWPSSYAVKLYEDLIIGLAEKRRNFSLNLKNHGGFFDWVRSLPPLEPLTDEEKKDCATESAYVLFEPWVELPWYAATLKPEDFLNSFKGGDPKAYVIPNLKAYGEQLVEARGQLAPAQHKKLKVAADKTEKERQAKEEPANSGYTDYMASKRAMNKPAPTKQTEKPKAAAKSELPPKREKVSEPVQQARETKYYSPQVEVARNYWKLPKLFTTRIVESRYLVMIDNAKPAEFARINDQYELLMEAAA